MKLYAVGCGRKGTAWEEMWFTRLDEARGRATACRRDFAVYSDKAGNWVAIYEWIPPPELTRAGQMRAAANAWSRVSSQKPRWKWTRVVSDNGRYLKWRKGGQAPLRTPQDLPKEGARA